jgi:integrase
MNFAKNFAKKSPKAARVTRPNKTSEAYWMKKVRKGTGASTYNARMMHEGESRNVSLGTTNQKDAARRAARLYLDLKTSGWSVAISNLEDVRGKKLFRQQPTVEEAPQNEQTVGWFIDQVSTILGPRAQASTISAYTGAFRCIARESLGKKKVSCKMADALPLASITPEKINAWRDTRFGRFNNGEVGDLILNRKKRTINATVRNAAALFSRDLLAQVAQRTSTPIVQNPFAGLKPFTVPQNKYCSKIEIAHLVSAAQTRLRRSVTVAEGIEAGAWIVFLLALFAGLRANEIDKLQWSQIDLEKKTISIKPTDCFTAKTGSSNADVPIEDQIVEELQWYRAQFGKTEKFVICPDTPLPVGKTGPERRRLNLAFNFLCAWLRNYEHEGTKPLAAVQKPIHELRKEAGSVVMRKSGIYQASLFLRHNDIQTTVRHYADTRSKETVGLGHLLVGQTHADQ